MMRIFLTILLLVGAPALAQPLWMVERGGVAVDHDLLDALFLGTKAGFSIEPDGRPLQVEVEKVSPTNLGVSSLQGRFTGHPESFFLLCRGQNKATVAFFQPGDGSAYRLDRTSGWDDLRQIDATEYGPCGGALSAKTHAPFVGAQQRQPALPLASPTRETGVADDGSRHDILIGYTPAAEEAMGGFDNIRAEAQLAVDAANWTYANSGIDSYLRLVHVVGTDYDEDDAWNYDEHVVFLADPADEQMDEMMTLRNQVGADFVSLLIDGRNNFGNVLTCGVAYVMQSDEIGFEFEHLAASVVSVSCATGNWSLSHEVGHNRGCAHNRQNAGIDGAYSYSYGLRFVGSDDVGYRTVMAYDHFQGGYERIPYFSNPDVNYAGVPTGIEPNYAGEAHNALTHLNTEAVCASFRGERTFVQFGATDYSDGSFLFPHPSINQAVIDSRQGGHLVLNNGDASYVGSLTEPRVFIHDGSSSVVLGGN